MLGNLFKPRWQHRDPTVRAQAVTELGTADDRETLARIAREDSHAAVRAAACAGLLDFSALDDRIQNDPDARVREAATERFMVLLAGTTPGAPSPEQRRRLIRHTDNPRALEHVARHSDDAESRRMALGGIDDAGLLFDLALSGHDEALRLTAAERLQDGALLRRLGREGRDKRVVRHAREQTRQRQREETEARQHREQLGQVVEALEHLARTHRDPLFEARLRQQEQHWQALASEADAEHHQRADRALAACRARLREQEEDQAREQQRQEAANERRAALETLEALLDGSDEQTWDEQLGALRSAVGTQERRWQAAIEDEDVVASERQRFERVLARWHWLIGLAEEAATAEADRVQALAREWPGALPAPSALRLAQQAEQARRKTEPARPRNSAPADRKKRPESAHRGLVAALRRELQRGNLKHANRLWHKAGNILDGENDPWLARQLERLSERRDELRDWHAFAAEPKKAQLCERMEALIDVDLDPPERATAIQALHEEWRALMSSDQDQDQALWDRFKGASDQAYQPCREHFAELDAQRAENLAQRRRLCDQLAEFIERENWAQADWQAVWEIRRAAPREWRDHSPVRFTDAREVQKRFSALLRDLDNRLEQAWEGAETERRRLIDAASELAQRDEVHEAAREARLLQQHWHSAPWLPPARHRTLQKRFRRQMDALFKRRDAANQARRDEQREERGLAESRLTEAEEQLMKPLSEQDSATLAALAGEIDSLGSALNRDGQRRADRLRDRLRRSRTELPRWRRWRDALDQLATSSDGERREADATLAVALEVLAGVESPASARTERMAWQLEQLPRMMKTARFQPLEESLSRLEERGDVALDPALRERMETALRGLEPRTGT